MAMSISSSRNGNTVFNSSLSCEGVMAGAFFPQPDFQVPEEIMSEHTGQYMMMPTWKFSHLVLIHPQLCFCFFKALFNGPPESAQPNQGRQFNAGRSVGKKIGILGFLAYGSPRKRGHPLKGPCQETDFSIKRKSQFFLLGKVNTRKFPRHCDQSSFPYYVTISLTGK
jgi:hypothetical protein